ncbi:MAG: endonuclease domain-containing protein [Caulobacteraceae bacterium]
MKRYPNGAIGRARHLRREMTLAEQTLWKALRKPDLGFRRQVPIGRHIVDFAHLRARLIVEVDGGWHDLPEKELHDALRDAWLKSQGYRVVRFRNQQVVDDPSTVVEAIRTLLPRGEKGRDEGVRAELRGREGEAPPAFIHQRSALTLTQPSPLEGEGS